MAQETYVHDGADWRKARQIYVYDGSVWRKVRTLFEQVRCVYHDHEWVRQLTAAYGVFGLVSYRGTEKLLVMSDDNDHVWYFDGSSWADLGAPYTIAPSIQVDSVGFGAGGDIYATNYDGGSGAAIYRWNGAAWVKLFSNGGMTDSTGQFFDDLTGNTYFGSFSGVWWDGTGPWAQIALAPSAREGYAHTATKTYVMATYTVYEVAGGVFTALPTQPPDPIEQLYVDTNGLLWTSGTWGLFKWDGASWVATSGVACEYLCQDERGDLILGRYGFDRNPYRLAANGTTPNKVEMQFPAAPSFTYSMDSTGMKRTASGRLFCIARHAAGPGKVHLFEWAEKT